MPRRATTPKHRAHNHAPSAHATEARESFKARPKHRTGGLLRRLGVAGRRGAALTAVASLTTVGVVGVGVAAARTAPGGDLVAQLQSNAGAAAPDASLLNRLGTRGDGQTSRSADRLSAAETTRQRRAIERNRKADAAKLAQLQRRAQSGGQVTRSKDLGSGDPKAIAQAMLADFGWSSSEFSCLDSLWTRESGWDPHAANPTSSAYGIPQALPGSKMATAGSDWADNPATQIKWGLGYIQGSYGSPCAAWSHSEAYGWY